MTDLLKSIKEHLNDKRLTIFLLVNLSILLIICYLSDIEQLTWSSSEEDSISSYLY